DIQRCFEDKTDGGAVECLLQVQLHAHEILTPHLTDIVTLCAKITESEIRAISERRKAAFILLNILFSQRWTEMRGSCGGETIDKLANRFIDDIQVEKSNEGRSMLARLISIVVSKR
ncbi:hypothetical protein PENTCL1PPCAC_26214, partial [Pristionchus entomophagus]